MKWLKEWLIVKLCFKSYVSIFLSLILIFATSALNVFNVKANSNDNSGVNYGNVALSGMIDAETPTWAVNAGYD